MVVLHVSPANRVVVVHCVIRMQAAWVWSYQALPLLDASDRRVWVFQSRSFTST